MKYQTEFVVKVKSVNKNIFTLITSFNTYTLGNEKIKKKHSPNMLQRDK